MIGEGTARKVGFLPGPVVSVSLFLLKRNVPFDLIILILVYGLFLSLFWVAPWRHRKWMSTGDERAEAFRKLVFRIRYALVTAMVVVPLIIIAHFICVLNMPVWVDDLLARSSTISNAAVRQDVIPIALGLSKLSRNSYIVAREDPARQPKFYAMPTRLALDIVSVDMVHVLHPAAWAILLVAVVFVIGLRLAELLGEGTFDFGREGTHVQPT